MNEPGDRTRTAPPELVFEPPAPGRWELETAHHGLRPLSPFLRDAYRRAFESGIVEPLQRYGLPLTTIEAKFVHGCLYMRPLAIGEKPGSPPKGPPPAFVMRRFFVSWKILLKGRLHTNFLPVQRFPVNSVSFCFWCFLPTKKRGNIVW